MRFRLLLDDGDTEAAIMVRRTEFEWHPTATAYRRLAETARAVGAGDPTPWALTVLHRRVARALVEQAIAHLANAWALRRVPT